MLRGHDGVLRAIGRHPDLRLQPRRVVVASVAAVVVLAGAGLGIWWVWTRGPDSISAEELREYPPIVFVWAEGNRAETTGSGDLYVARADGTRVRRVKAWTTHQGRPDGHVYGTYDASWSPDRRLIALTLSVWYGDPFAQVAVVSPNGHRLRKLSDAFLVGDVTWSPRGALLYSYDGDLRVVSPRTGHTRRIWRPRNGVIDERFSVLTADWGT